MSNDFTGWFDIYAVEFPNGKLYFGITSEGTSKRIRRHKYDVKKGSNTKFHNALRKYSNQAIWYTLDVVDDKYLAYLLEIFLISEFNTTSEGYNITLGGEGRHGAKASKETKLKQRLAKLGKKAPERNKEWRSNISKAKKGVLNPMSKIDLDIANLIRDMRTSGLWLKDIAACLNLSESVISNISRGKVWNG